MSLAWKMSSDLRVVWSVIALLNKVFVSCCAQELQVSKDSSEFSFCSR